ncbi:hypothetical protein R3P38DRAFT_2787547 [Favolaschia claudopus]|uniref:Uncharacterized protein n=1 Tax=Favolaschia claudopus TaxID=2862362 RepID=A0AAW0ANZ1_9AGAR
MLRSVREEDSHIGVGVGKGQGRWEKQSVVKSECSKEKSSDLKHQIGPLSATVTKRHTVLPCSDSVSKEKAAAKAKHAAELLRANLLRPLVSLQEMDSLTIPKIVDQLNSYRARGVQNILKVSNYKLKADKLKALRDAYHWYQSNIASLSPPSLPPTTVEPTTAVIDDWGADEDVEMEE